MKKLFLPFLILFVRLTADPIPVLVTLPPLEFFVEQIGGDQVTVESLVPAGAGAHGYEPAPRQLEGVKKSVLWFTVGETVEARVASIDGAPKQVDLRKDISLLQDSCCGAGADPHIWLSPQRAKRFSRTIATALTAQSPFLGPYFAQNLARLEKELDQLDQELARQLSPCRGKTILVSHPAYGYFCADYGLHQLAIEFEGKEPTPKQLARTLKRARTAGVKRLILDPHYGAKGARLVANELGIPLCTVDPLAQDYFANLHHLANCICP